MEWLQDTWREVIALSPNWDLILRFLEIVIWPLVVLMAVAMIKPGRIIDAMLENGGEIAAGGAAIRLGKRIGDVAEEVRTDAETAGVAAPKENPLEEAADPYTTIMNGWGLVIAGLEEAVERTGLPRLDKRNPMETVQRLRREDWIGKRLASSIQELWDVRNQVTRAGSNRLKRLGITPRTADQYYDSAGRIQTGISRAIVYRERKAAVMPPPMAPTAGGEPEQRPN